VLAKPFRPRDRQTAGPRAFRTELDRARGDENALRVEGKLRARIVETHGIHDGGRVVGESLLLPQTLDLLDVVAGTAKTKDFPLKALARASTRPCGRKRVVFGDAVPSGD
jgi:hypothetical protein